jgi:hypothetical protein
VLDAPKGGLSLSDTKSNGTLPMLVYLNIIVASNVQLSWFMRFVMEFFIPYLLASNPILDSI